MTDCPLGGSVHLNVVVDRRLFKICLRFSARRPIFRWNVAFCVSNANAKDQEAAAVEKDGAERVRWSRRSKAPRSSLDRISPYLPSLLPPHLSRLQQPCIPILGTTLTSRRDEPPGATRGPRSPDNQSWSHRGLWDHWSR